MNEIIESTKVTPQGLIKVELFDDVTGQKVEEVNTHNFISQGILRNLFNAKVNDIFTKGRATNQHEASSIFIDPFAQISLTTADHPESSETEWLRAGKLIGYAYSDATYSGADVLRGGYNAAESFTKPGHVHMVFDFPTNAANGEFSSIYFHPKQNGHAQVNFSAISALSSANAVKKYNDLYFVLKTQKLQKYDMDWKLLEEYGISDVAIYDFEIVDDVIYYVGYSTTNTVKQADLSNPTVMSPVISIPGSQCGGITFDSIASQFVIADIGTVKKLRFYSKSFEPISTRDIPQITANFTTGQLSKQVDFFVIGKESVDTEGNVLSIEYDKIAGISDFELFIPGYVFPKTFIGSRCLLDAPITKTAQQTMKITYDFVLPSIY